MSARQMALIGLVGLMPLPLVGCGSPEEMVRVTSPDQRVDAVWVRESGGGATVGFSYKLFIVPIGGIPTRGHERLLAGDVANLKLDPDHSPRLRAPSRVKHHRRTRLLQSRGRQRRASFNVAG